jgi:hypothetical protein
MAKDETLQKFESDIAELEDKSREERRKVHESAEYKKLNKEYYDVEDKKDKVNTQITKIEKGAGQKKFLTPGNSYPNYSRTYGTNIKPSVLKALKKHGVNPNVIGANKTVTLVTKLMAKEDNKNIKKNKAALAALKKESNRLDKKEDDIMNTQSKLERELSHSQLYESMKRQKEEAREDYLRGKRAREAEVAASRPARTKLSAREKMLTLAGSNKILAKIEKDIEKKGPKKTKKLKEMS